jgi:predicted phosphoribosyltransferase/dienelactone hydrolase
MPARTEQRVFHDRREAGRALAAAVRSLGLEAPIVFGLPRGGVPVAFEVAEALDAPLDVIVARKIGAPGNPELAIGAIAEDGVQVLDHAMIGRLLVSHEELEHAIARAASELEERAGRYRGGAPRVPLEGRTAVVVDDGLATGSTARAALRAIRARGARRVVLAAPVGAKDTVEALRGEADDIVCVIAPDPLWAIGFWYLDFGQTSDYEVVELLRLARGAARAADPVAAAPDPAVLRPVAIALPGSGSALTGDLVVPAEATALVVFAHGSGSSRHSPRNRHVAASLNRAGLATLLLDLLTPEEELDRRNVFDIPLLAGRLLAATAWAEEQPEVGSLPTGYFGASTGAGAALWAAAEAGDRIGAVVSRGGRPDLAAPRLARVRSSVLLIVGGRDPVVVDLNRQALALLRADTRLAIVPGATHLFEEPGALDEVARLAADWFARHLTAGSRRTVVA